jgi:hypothetical protein
VRPEPEYLELWMQVPGQDQAGRIVASQSKSLFRLNFLRAGDLKLIIFGSYRSSPGRKIFFDWWKTSSNLDASQVEIRLDGCFGCSILSLTHRGILDEEKYLWQKECGDRPSRSFRNCSGKTTLSACTSALPKALCPTQQE